MKRDLARLAGERFDLAVVGGGSHGAAAAREAARRGLSVALVERGDFACATSANSLKIVHGGLRYLQYADLAKVREAVRARRGFFRLFPGLVRPLPCVLPTEGFAVRGRAAMAVALALNDLLSLDRNRGVAAGSHLPRGRVVARAEMLRIAPGLAGSAVTGGALWHDGIAEDTERVVLGLVADAACHGAAVANHVEAAGFLRTGDVVEGVAARDLVTGAELEIRARVVLNAAGPWLDRLNGKLGGARPALPLAKAVNILVGRPLFDGLAVGLAGSREHRESGRLVDTGRRFFFFVPWRGGTMVGTSYREHEGGPDECAVTARDVEEMVGEANRIYPAARILPEEVRFAHVGLLPLGSADRAAPAEARLLKRPCLVDGSRELGVEGFLAVRSVKYTTACVVAEQAVRMVAAKLGRALPAPGPERALTGWEAAGGVAPDDATPAARVGRAVRDEMALTLADIVFRRTGIGSAGHPGPAALEECATLAAAELGWDGARRAEEIGAVEAEYRRLTGRGTP